MKYYKRLDVYKASNNEVSLTNMTAYSYGWWKYLTKVELTTGKSLVIFNNSSYSASTNKHQSNARWLLHKNNIEVDVWLHTTTKALDFPRRAINGEIENLIRKVSKLLEEIDNKGTTKAKNEERAGDIESIIKRIRKLKKIAKQIKGA
tara:strand:+ start:241 stop:684 length:444 start_codon:yes stop_codon:yes gene_type:complete